MNYIGFGQIVLKGVIDSVQLDGFDVIEIDSERRLICLHESTRACGELEMLRLSEMMRTFPTYHEHFCNSLSNLGHLNPDWILFTKK